MKKSSSLRFYTFFCIISLLSSVSAQSKIAVGYFPLENFNMLDSSGNVRGYNVDYLNKIAEYTKWEYTYIEYDSWSSALEEMKKKEIQLLAPAPFTLENAQLFDYPAFPIGREYGAMLTLNTTEEYSYENFDSFDNIKVGVECDFHFFPFFEEYKTDHKFNVSYRYYENKKNLVDALYQGEVDVILTNLMNMTENMKLLARFGVTPSYYLVEKGNQQLLTELNEALQKIQIHNPLFENQLIETYLWFYKINPLTKTELDFLQKIPTLTVACISNQEPISYLDSAGEVRGITRDILDLISKNMGINFSYFPLPTSMINYNFLKENEISLVSSVEYNELNSHSSGLILSNPYISTQKVVLARRGEKIEINQVKKMGLVTGSKNFMTRLKEKYSQFEFILYDNIEEGLNAVVSGKIDYLIQNQYAVERLMAKPQYNNLVIIPKEGSEDVLCLSIVLQQEDDFLNTIVRDSRLLSIINKGIAALSKEELDRIIIQNTFSSQYPYSYKDFLYEYRIVIVLVLIIISALIVIYIISHLSHIKTVEIIRRSEKKLLTITSNINGGVVVLIPSEGLSIHFANDGFFRLLQYTSEEYYKEYQQEFITIVHPEDLARLRNLINTHMANDEQISTEVRIRCKNGNYLDSLFNGTISKKENNVFEIYCVITDISNQKRMMEQLELQQQRYEVIINRTQEIIFDIDLLVSDIVISANFEKKFGWTIPYVFSFNDLALAWHVHPEDSIEFMELFYKLLSPSNIGFYPNIDTDATLRIMTKTQIPIWCNISIHSIQKNRVPIRLIGRIYDVDSEMKEKMQLMETAEKDKLTGLYRKETFYTMVEKSLNTEKNITGALLFLDLDNFKSINDIFGHMRGDEIIIETAEKLQIIFSNIDILSRFGGDEFCIFVKNIPLETLLSKLNWTLEKLRHTYREGENEVLVTTSIGVALIPEHGKLVADLLAKADKALYDSKQSGKNRYTFYTQEEK